MTETIPTSRREFTQKAIASLMTFSLVDAMRVTNAFTPKLKGALGHWLGDLDAVCREVKSEKLKQVEWQKKVEELFARVEVSDFMKLINFEALEKKADYGGPGAKSLVPNFPTIEGVPTKLIFGRQVFVCKKDRSVVPHGHDNMATAFLVLKGTFRGRHYERVKDEPEHMIITPTIDRKFEPGGCSTISDFKDNVHWFKSESDWGFILNIHVMGVNSKLGRSPARVYIDPNGEKVLGGQIRARVIGHAEADKLYG